MRPLRALPALALLTATASAGTVVDLAPVEVRPSAQTQAVSPVPALQLSPTALTPGLSGALIPTLAAPAAPVALAAVKPAAIKPVAGDPATTAIGSLRGGASKLAPGKDGKAPSTEKQRGALTALYDNGSAASTPDDPASGSFAAARPSGLAPYKPGEAPAKNAVPVPTGKVANFLSRFPLYRGEIGWKRFVQLVLPGSELNTVKSPFKLQYERDREAAMRSQNLRYALGFAERDFEQEEIHQRLQKQAAFRAETRAKVLAAYGLPPFSPNAPPLVALGAKLGEGGQGVAYKAEGRPGRAIKVFRGATGEQLQEMAAILDAVADQGFAVERAKVVRLPDGRFGLEMREVSRDTGWKDLATYYRFHRNDPAAREAVNKAEKILFAVGAETKRVLGFEASDWKAGFSGPTSDDHLENFVINEKTGEVSCFDCLVRW